ncbi:MAG: diacylglycerol kinase family protein [Kineosporiaceae bacterium]
MSGVGAQITVLLVVLVLAAALVVLLARASGPSPADHDAVAAPAAAAPDPGPSEPPARQLPLLAVVVNPTKVVDTATERAWIGGACALAGWREPLWLETTPEDPGRGQARQALAAGADVVAALGGDGTVRMVAGELAATGVPLALLPAGTGNLLARNLQLPITDRTQALRVAMLGRDRAIDVAQAEIDPPVGGGGDPDAPAFLVMAGLGFDADVMAAVDPRLKERVGWWAYVVAGAANLRGKRRRIALHMDGRAPIMRRVRSVVIGNCGALAGGVRLMPEALVDDGWLDVVTVSPRGLVGWVAVVTAVLTRTHRTPVIEHFRCRSLEILCEEPLQAQIDGDPIGASRVLRVAVRHQGLLVRVP